MVIMSEMIVRGLKFLLFTYFILKYSFIYAILFYILSDYSYHYILYYLFNIEEVTAQEYTMVALRNENKSIMTGYFVLESFNEEKIKNMIIEKAIKKFKRLRMKMTFSLGGFYWEESTIEEAIKQIKIMPELNLQNNEDLQNYSLKHHAIPFKLNEFPFEFHLIRHGKEKAILFLKFDHILGDGIGLLGLLIAMADNYSLALYPKLHELSLVTKLLVYITLPYYYLKGIIASAKLYYEKTPFRVGEDLKRSNVKSCAMSKNFEFDSFYKICKQHKMTFNDLIMAILAKAAKLTFQKYTPEGNFETKELVLSQTVSLRPMPESLETHKIINDVSAIPFTLKLIDDPIKERKIIQKSLDKSPFEAIALLKMLGLIKLLIPSFLLNAFMLRSMDNLDIAVSNVPGPRKELYFAGIKATDLVIMPTANCMNFMVMVYSYNEKFQFTAISDTATQVTPKSFIKFIENEVEDIISNYKF